SKRRGNAWRRRRPTKPPWRCATGPWIAGELPECTLTLRVVFHICTMLVQEAAETAPQASQAEIERLQRELAEAGDVVRSWEDAAKARDDQLAALQHAHDALEAQRADAEARVAAITAERDRLIEDAHANVEQARRQWETRLAERDEQLAEARAESAAL